MTRKQPYSGILVLDGIIFIDAKTNHEFIDTEIY